MTDDNRNQQEGTPAADQGAGQEPERPQIKLDLPDDMKDMTAQELLEYARGNPEAWQETVKGLNDRLHVIGDMLARSATGSLDAALKAGMTPGVTSESLQKAMGRAIAPLKNVDFGIAAQLASMNLGIKSEIVARRISEIEADLLKIVRAVAIANQFTALPDDVDAEALDALYTECEELKPYIAAELEKRKEELADMTADEFMDYLPTIAPRKADKEEIPAEAKTKGQQLIDDVKADLLAILNAARAARDAQEAAEAEKQQRESLPSVTYTKKTGIELTTDKLMTVFFGANAPAPKGQIDGQMSFLPVKYEKTGAPEITLYYNYSFDDDVLKRLKLEKKIDDEDYFILSFLANFWRAGDKILSPSKLFRELTGDDPNTTQLTTFTNKLIRLATTNIFINDKEVREAWGLQTYKEVVAPLAPIKIGAERFIASGQVVKAGLEILDEPVIMRLGYEMGQFTTIPKSLLHVKKSNGRKIKRTARFYRVLHFLIRRIAAMKSGNLSNKILYDTFYEETGEKSPRDKQNALNMLYTILEHFKSCDKWITGYKEETTASTGKVGVRIYYNQPTAKITQKAHKKKK